MAAHFVRPLAFACVVVAALLHVAPPADAQENADCLECHNDPDFKEVRDGKEVSFHIDPETFARSVHGSRNCIDCHFELEGTDFPHETGTETAQCGECHEDEAEHHRKSLHGQAAKRGDPLAPTCADCHGVHDVKSPSDETSPTFIMNIPRLCGKCHHEGSAVSLTHDIPQERIFENYSMSMHGEGLYRKGLRFTAVCTSCHTSHFILPHTDPQSSIARENVVKTCTACHAQIELVHEKVIEGERWEKEAHQLPICVDCHSPHKIRRHERSPATMTSEACLGCHSNRDLTMERDGKTISLFVDRVAYSGSTHHAVECAQCHSEVSAPFEEGERTCWSIKSKVDCSACHEQQVLEYRSSTHGTLAAQGDPDAPVCLDCHDKHATLSKSHPLSPTFPRNVPDLCGRCHREGEKAAERISGRTPHIVASYRMSIHWKGMSESGLTVTASCANCHTAHHELPPTNPESSVSAENVAKTCGTCHYGIEEKYKKSIHWHENVDTDKPLPSCKDCHSSHTISRVDAKDFRFMMMEQCGRCHQTEAETFFDTFHGKVSRLGSSGAAKCYDCHGTHNILPPSNPDSTLSRQNVVQTCGQCHEGAHRRFAGYLTHATHHDAKTYPWLFWTFWGMTALLVGTLAFALLHTLAWLMRLSLTKHEWKAHKALARTATGAKLYRRFNRYQRGMHLMMIISFFLLAITGMALKFSYTKWAQAVAWILGGSENAAVLHRTGAVILIGVFVAHVISVRRLKRSRGVTWRQLIAGPDSIIFNKRDLREFRDSIRWFFGLGARPKYGRYTYWEKFDYFAVFWGVAVIGTTGLILWFPELMTHIVPGWFINVATIIHSDEALLAVGFIFTIHFFNTHFRPDKFPMDPVIFTGRITIDELKYDKPDEYRHMVETGRLEEHLVDPFPKPVEQGARIFGFIALFVGLTLIGLIVYAMIFGYQ